MRRAILGLVGLAGVGLVFWLNPVASQPNEVKRLAPGVYFHEGDLGKGHCNNGWIVFDDYVLVVDANFPSGAQEVIPKIRATTNKPIRFAFDTHHHGDHAYGNQVWVDAGAVPVGHVGVLAEMKKYEPGRWNDAAKGRPDVAASKLKAPSLLFQKELFFDDGGQRVELHHFGVAHTHGDGWAWLPKERILFSGDACVNGPYNYTGDGNIGRWIRTLEAAQRLEPRVIAPGHGPVGDASLLEDQRQFFLELRRQAKLLLDGHRSPSEAAARVDAIRAAMLKQDRIKKYVGDMFASQVEKAYVELGGMPFPPRTEVREEGDRHASAHGLQRLPVAGDGKTERQIARKTLDGVAAGSRQRQQ